MIDLHTHILPDLDDGSRSLRESMETLRMLNTQGCDTVICTPHISPFYSNSERTIQQKYDELKEALSATSFNMTLLYGAEYSCETLCERIMQNQPVMYINPDNKSMKYLLVEFPFVMKPLWLDKMMDSLTRDNIGVIVAHPERCGKIDLCKEIAQHCDCLFAINGSSVLGDEGTQVKKNAFFIMSRYCEKIVFASDAHPALHRYPQFDKLVPCLQKIYSQVMINYWFTTLPHMIVLDKKISESEKSIIHLYADMDQKM